MLDPLRGLAALAILLVHTALFSGVVADKGFAGDVFAHLDIGVPFFFLLSAFLLYRPFVAARVAREDHTPFREYAKRRFVRIMPAYWAVLTITAIVPGMAGAFSENWWVYYGLLQDFPVYEKVGECAVNPYRCGVPVAWSLTVEVLFYAMLPLIVVGLNWLHGRWRGRPLTLELSFVALLSLASFAVQASVPRSDAHTYLFYSPIGRGWWFGLGLALAAISVEVARRQVEPAWVDWIRRRPTVPVAAGAISFLLMVGLLFDGPAPLAFPVVEQWRYVLQYFLVGVIAAMVILPAIFGNDGDGLVRQALRHRSLVWLGLVSYGVFLWHFPVLVALLDIGVRGFWALTGLTLAITLVCAAASYYLLERPLMRRVRSRPAVAGAAGEGAALELAMEKQVAREAESAVSPSARA